MSADVVAGADVIASVDADGSAVIVVLVPHPSQATQATPQAQTQQRTDAQLRHDIEQSAAEVRRLAQENARSQLEAARAKLEQQRAQLEAQRAGGPDVVVAPPAIPAPPAPRITIVRDGKPVLADGADNVGTTTQTGMPPFLGGDIPHGAVVLGESFFMMLAFIAVGLPLARAWARRMDRPASAATAAPFPSDVTDRLERIEHAVESIAIEVERVSEGQRFTTKLLTERGDAPAVAAGPAAAQPNSFSGGGR